MWRTKEQRDVTYIKRWDGGFEVPVRKTQAGLRAVERLSDGVLHKQWL